MPDDTALGQIISDAYSAAIIGDGWEPWLRQLADTLGSVGGLFGILNRRSGTLDHAISLCDNPNGWDEYVAGMGFHDPNIRYISNLSGPSLMTIDQYIDRADPANADYLRWEEDRFDFYSGTTLVGDIDADRIAGFCFHFPRDTAGRAQRGRDRLASQHRAIVQAMRLGFTHHRLLQDSYWEGIRAQTDDRAAWLLDATGRVLRLNKVAEAMLGPGGALTCRAGQLGSRDGGNATRLRTLIDRAVVSGEGGVAPLRRDGGRPLIATIDPLPRSSRSLVAAEAAALLTVSDLARPVAPATELWRTLFGLTVAEARVGDVLREGQPDGDIATRLGLRVSTVRSHIKAILDKTGTHSKAELVALLARAARP